MAQCLSYFSYCSTLSVGCYLYTDPKRTTTVGAGWVFDGTTNWVVNSSGMITGTASCQATPAGNSEWSGGFISETGQYQIVINIPSNSYVGYLWESSDYGATWTENTSAGAKSWQHISISSNGVYRVAAVDSTTNVDGGLYVSTNSGLTYTYKNLAAIRTAISDNGQIMYATNYYAGVIYKSTDYGSTFSSVTALGSGSWQQPSTSSNGQWVLVGSSGNDFSFKRSGDYGVSWSTTGPLPPYNYDMVATAMSNSGQYQMGGPFGVGPYISSDYGATFTQKLIGNNYTKAIEHVAMSGSGQFMLAADTNSMGSEENNGWIWRSINYGVTFDKAVGRPGIGTGNWWTGVGIGGTYALAVSRYHIFRSTNSGESWAEVLTDPSVNPFTFPAVGTYLDSVCVNCDLVAIRANGSGGSYQAETIQYNTEVCCFGGPGGGGGGGGEDIV